MKNGDLANTVGYTFGFRCEDFLIEFQDKTLLDKAYNAVFDKVKRAKVNEEVKAFMEHLYRDTEYTVDLVVEKKNYTEELKRLIEDLPFNRIVLIDDLSQVAMRLMVGDLTYYVDDSEERRGLVNNNNTRTLHALAYEIRQRG